MHSVRVYQDIKEMSGYGEEVLVDKEGNVIGHFMDGNLIGHPNCDCSQEDTLPPAA